MKTKKILGLTILVLLLTGAGMTYLFSSRAAVIEMAFTNTPQTAAARRGDISLFTTGTGAIIASAQTTASFDESGTLIELLVSVGDEVKTGDILAWLQTDQSPTQLNAQIVSAELAVLNAQLARKALDENAGLDAAKALLAVETAQENLANLKDQSLALALADQTVAEMQSALESAETALALLNSIPSDAAIATAQASLLFKENDLAALQAEAVKVEHKIKTAPTEREKRQFEGQLQNPALQIARQQIDYENARYQYEHISDPADPLALATAEAKVTAAQARLNAAQRAREEAQTGPTPSETALAEAALQEAQSTWEKLQTGPDPVDVALADADLAAAQAELDLLRAEQTLVPLTAPMDGTVISIEAIVGQAIGNTPVLTIANLETPYLQIYLDETDFTYGVPGYEAVVSFDALPDITYTGEIAAVTPGLVSTNRVQGLEALVRLELGTTVRPQRFPIGMNASVDVIAAQAKNTILVPAEALVQAGPEAYVVYVRAGNDFEKRTVEVGIVDYTSAEIKAGLDAGEVVALNYETGE